MITDPYLLRIMAEEQAKLKKGPSKPEQPGPDVFDKKQKTPEWKPGQPVPEGYIVTTFGLVSKENFRENYEKLKREQQPKTTGIDNRIPELEQQAKEAREMASGKDIRMAEAAMLGFEVPSAKELLKEAERVEIKADIIRQYQRTHERIDRLEKGPPESINKEALKQAKKDLEKNKPVIDAITSKELSPFIEIDEKGNYLIDIAAAIQAGVSEDLLKQAQKTPDEIESARKYLQQVKVVRAQKADIARFERNHVKIGEDGQYIAKSELEKVKQADPAGYRVLVEKGFDAYNARLEFFPDGLSMLKTEYLELPDKYRVIAKVEGFNKMMDAIEADEKAQNDAITTMEKYKKGEGYDLYHAIQKVEPETMRLAGFDEKDIDKAVEAKKASIETGVALPGTAKELRSWYEKYNKAEINLSEKADQIWKDNPRLSDKQREKLVEKTDEYKHFQSIVKERDPLSTEADIAKRIGVETVSTLFFAPARMALPEVKAEDIKPIDYGVGAAQLAMWAMPVMPKGIIPYASTGAASIFGYTTYRNWNDMNTIQKSLAVAGTVIVALPALGSVAKGMMPVSVKVPTKTGNEVTVWTGVSVKGKPVVGVSEGRLTVGSLGVKRPMFGEIKPGYEPVTKIETSLMSTRRALTKMGVSEADIAKVESTLHTRQMFAGKKSPYMDYKAFLEGTERITPDEMAVILRESVKKGQQIEQIYGSSTIKPQLKPELQKWRGIHDIDIQTKMSDVQVAKFTKELLAELKKRGSNVKLDPKGTGSILKKVDDEWVKITDIHTKDVIPGSETAPEGAYGMVHAESPIKVKLPGVGELKLMRLSESGKRKAASILEFQEGAIAPKAHRVNDVADYYVILKTFKGDKIADKWAESYGYVTKSQKAALLKYVEKNPPKIEAFSFSPSVKVVGKQPTISIVIPPSLTVKTSPALKKKIESYSPIVSPSLMVRTTLSPSVIASVKSSSSLRSVKPITSPSIIPSLKPSPAKVSPSVKPSSPSLKPGSPSVSPAKSPSPKPSPSLTPLSKSLSPSPATSPKPSPSPTPSPVPSPSPTPVTPRSPSPATGKPTKKPPVPSGKGAKDTPWTADELKSAIAWKDGFVVHALKYPYRRGVDEKTFHVDKVPPGLAVLDVHGKGSESKSIKVPKGRLTQTLTVDVGNQDKIIKPISGGRRARIRSVRDTKNTTSQMTIKRKNLSKKRGKVFHTKANGGTIISRRPFSGY